MNEVIQQWRYPHRLKLKFADMNLKKLACCLWKEKLTPFHLNLFGLLYDRNPVHA